MNNLIPIKTEEICAYLDHLLSVPLIRDFPNAYNGLQVENEGNVTCLGGAVDANPESLRLAIQNKVDFLCVHHGLHGFGVRPLIGNYGQFYKTCFSHNVAIYSVHLPLDMHPIVGHNASISRLLHLTNVDTFAHFEGQAVGIVAQTEKSRQQLKQDLEKLFPRSLHSLEFGPIFPKRIGIVSGSGGQTLLEKVQKYSIDTLITGEVRYAAFTFAQFYNLNIYACGHYATEVFGIKNLLAAASKQFNLPHVFIDVESDL
ncbi:MAG: Nif3-like dinuclear metal center hexameric protein [Puniceicoccales bacterium]|jgi:dinuclear metal center YbgI/SA1388 family protein|nr:Nif3-like dinuclear metal center hexameric protein [Puniceicoccales bacterium]